MSELPLHIINKILLYNIHPCAEIIKQHIQNKIIEIADIIISFEEDYFYNCHFYSKLTTIDKLIFTELLNKTKHNWYFCCDDTGITVNDNN